MWRGDTLFLLQHLVLKDFRIRYRNMSLGVFWSLLNPLVMMGVLTFVFTRVFRNPSPQFPVFVLCGLIPYSFFTVAWITGTLSIVDSAGLIKRMPVPRQIVPIASVLSNCVHLGIQILLLLAAALWYGRPVTALWLWLAPVWFLEIIFVCGLCLITASMNVYLRDMRYIVESVNTILFWLVPIFYPLEIVPMKYAEVYQLNPVAAIVLCLRNVLLNGTAPLPGTLWKLAGVSCGTLVVGYAVFQRGKRGFYEHI